MIYTVPAQDERTAFADGEKAALAALNRVCAVTGKQDINHQGYVVFLSQNSYNASLEAAKQHFGDSNIQQAVNTVVRDREEGRMVTYHTRSEKVIAQLIDVQNARTTSHATSKGTAQGNTQGALPATSSTIRVTGK